MKTVIFILSMISVLFLSGVSQSADILEQLKNNEDWKVIKDDAETQFRRKPLRGFDLYALEISREVKVSPGQVFAVLLDVASYPEVLADNDLLEAEEVERDPEQIIGYQFARLPLVSNRHYLFSFDLTAYEQSLKAGAMNLHWTLLEPDGKYSGFIKAKEELNNNPIYIANGAGLWMIREVEDGVYENVYRLYLDPAGWMPGWLVNSFNQKNLEQLFNRVLAAAEKRS
ncbi:MAG: hypothetical protein K9M99_01140 [Candidatus Cloacimonetes bacterium]|nr:hypothetical protein [Candidatus Cloacimonadota bacterium]